MNYEKEQALNDFVTMIKQSWTWARLTKDERNKFLDLLQEERNKISVKGTFKQRWNIYQSFYDFYIEALGYKPIGWRGE